MCPFYSRLAEILNDRASTIPPYLSDSVDIDSGGLLGLMGTRDIIDLDGDGDYIREQGLEDDDLETLGDPNDGENDPISS